MKLKPLGTEKLRSKMSEGYRLEWIGKHYAGENRYRVHARFSFGGSFPVREIFEKQILWFFCGR